MRVTVGSLAASAGTDAVRATHFRPEKLSSTP
jgi:hypothetical protein